MGSVPTLRFKEFQNDWANCRLIDIAELQRGFDLPSADRVEGIVPIVSSGGVTGFHCESKVQPPGIVMGRYGSIGEVFYVEEPFWPLNTTLWVKDFKHNLTKFAYYLLSTIDYSRYSDKTGVPGVNRNDLHAIKVAKPDGSEQQKIATFLTAVDTKIEQLSKKEALLKQYKKGVMQKIFSQEIRFKADDGSDFPEWANLKVSEVFESVSTRPFQILATEISDAGEFPVVDQGQKLIAGYSDHQAKVCSDLPMVIFGDHTTELKFVEFSFVVGADGTKLLKAIKGHSPKYLFYNLQFNNVVSEGYKRHFSILKGIHLQVPSLPEQIKIAEFLSAIDSKVARLASQLEAAKTFKKGLLQQMFV